MECNVCVSKYTKRDRKEIKCPYCEYSACRACCETYILSQTEPKCMNCKKEWSKRFMRDAFTVVFLTGKYKDHVCNGIFEREKSFMPATQPYIERRRESEKIMEEIHALEEELMKIRQKINDKYGIYRELLGNVRHVNSKRTYVRPCGYCAGNNPEESCRGFMDENNECGICGIKACLKCDVFLPVDGEEHECKEADLETAKMIRKETRPCPKCSVAIYKISGCDQMWCVQCHTAFSWNTGEIENRIHNPHYYEWMAQQAQQNNQTQNEFLRQQREIYDGICENRLTGQMAQRILTISNDYYNFVVNSSSTKPQDHWGERISSIIMHAIHMSTVDIYRYRVPPREEIEMDNRPERILYMMGEMTENIFKDLVCKKERKYEKYREYTQIINMYLTVVLDITRRLLDDNKDPYKCVIKTSQIEQYLMEYDAIRVHANKCFEDVSKSHFSVLKIIDKHGTLV